MAELAEPKWYPRLGSTEIGEPLLTLLYDTEVGRLRSELNEFPGYLLGQQRDGNERGTILQIAVRRGQAQTVSVIVAKLLSMFDAAASGQSPPSALEESGDYVHTLDEIPYPRLVNEDPLGCGSLATILHSLEPIERSRVAGALLDACPYLHDETERAIIGLMADCPEIVAQAGTQWSQIDQLLLALEFGADRCIQQAYASGNSDLEDQELLHRAALRNLPNAIRRLVQKGADPSERDSLGQTPLHRASSVDAERSVRTLLELGSNGLIEDIHGDIALVVAIKKDAMRAALLLATTVDIDSHDLLDRAVAASIQARRFELTSILLNLNSRLLEAKTDPLERLLKDVLLSDEQCKWLFALLAQLLAAADSSDFEVMPLLSIGDFMNAGRLLGAEFENPHAAMEAFLSAVVSEVGFYDGLHQSLTVFGAPLCLLFCATSLATAITKENTSFHQLHPQMRALFKPRYEDWHLGEAWNNMRGWMERRGLRLAWPEDTWLTNVGAPLYHAIWRPDDREDLFDALGSLGVDLARNIQPDEMGILLDRAFSRLSSHIQRMLRTESDRSAVLKAACANLSAERVQRRGRNRSFTTRAPWATLGWYRDKRSGQISLTATLPCLDGMPDSIVLGGIEVVSNGGTYQPLSIRSDWIDDEGKLTTEEGLVFRIPSLAGPLIFESLGRRSMTYSLGTGEPQLVVCPVNMLGEVAPFLTEVQGSEAKQGVISHFPDMVALGPVTPTHESHGLIPMSRRIEVAVELIGGIRLQGARYHRSMLPRACVLRDPNDSEWRWIVDEVVLEAKVVDEDDGLSFITPPEGGTDYRLVLSGKEVARFIAGPSVFEGRQESKRTRWPILLPKKGEFEILGVSGDDVSRVRISRKTGLPFTSFRPFWALDVKAIPLVALIPEPNGTAYSAEASKAVAQVQRAGSGDGMSQSRAQRLWELYAEKARK
ncbi:ankyrin repeat domain-containing protein [Kamptonema cortianum]|nr:ankyrin repeat domain-containing protein [Geitlerinema splendidum]MDK3157101.1 ankyrin repeat domain-containing protein [Kamptonema cortianum]